MATYRRIITFFLLVLLVGATGQAEGKPIGAEPRVCSCCSSCNQGASDTPGGVCACPIKHGTCGVRGCGIPIAQAKTSETYRVFNALSDTGTGLDFSLFYASYNADNEKAVIESVMGYGWSHSYNIYLFKQRYDLFKMGPTGITSKYKRQGRRSGPLKATRGHQQTIVENPDGSVEISNNDQLTFRFEPIPGNPLRVAGQTPLMLKRITDRNNNVTTLNYVNGQLEKVTGPYTREIKFEYNAQNRLSKVIDPASRETTFSYDGAGNLTTVTDPLGRATSYEYNVFHQITLKSDRSGRVWHNDYDANLHPVAVRDGNDKALFTMSNSSNWATDLTQLFRNKQRVYIPSTTTVTDGRGNQWRYSYDKDGLITKIVAPDGATIAFTYDPITLNKATQTDDNGHTTSFEYDPKGNQLKHIDALGNQTLFEYEPVYNMMTRHIDTNGRVTVFEYDGRGNLTKETDPLGAEQRWTYDARGNVLSQTDKNGQSAIYEYGVFGNRTKATDALGNVTTMTYDIIGNLLTRTDDNTHTTRFQYDPLDRLIATTDAVGNVSHIDYDPEGNRLLSIDRNGNATQFEYDLRDRLVKTIDALGQIETMSYDDNDNRVSRTDRNGHLTSFSYDVQNRMVKTTDAEGFMTARSYDGEGRLLVQTDANLHATTMLYDNLDRLIRITDAEGNVTSMEYDTLGLVVCPACTGPAQGSGLVTKQIDAEDKVTYFKYDALDRRIIEVRKQTDVADVIDGDDAVTTTDYDPVGNVLARTEPNGNTVTYEYDAINRVTKEINAAGDTQTTVYDGVSNTTSSTAANGNTMAYTYDALDRLMRMNDDIGLVATFTYDSEGNRLTQRDGNGNGNDFEYDGLYRVVKVTDTLGKSTTSSYDAVGNLLAVTDREGKLISHLYDDINRRISTTDALPATTLFDYDGVGNLVKHTDANSHTTDYEFDGINRLVKETYADGGSRLLSYNGVSDLLSRTDQKGQTTTYVYNDLHFLTKRDYPVSPDDTFTYDLSRRLLTAERDGWLVSFEYDGANRVTKSTQNTQVIDYLYNIPGRTRTLAYPGGRTLVEQTDARAKLTSINDAGSPPPVVSYNHDLADRLTGRTYRNGIISSYVYNTNNWLVELNHNGTSLVAGFVHAYDNEGNKRFEQRLHQTTRSEAYQYDDIYRLIDYKVGNLVGVTVPIPATQTQYDLDLLGNWDTKTTDTVVQTRTHSATNEITLIDAIPIIHDDNGNNIEDGTFDYTYDEENRLTQVTRKLDNLIVAQYQYDALSRRVVKIAQPLIASLATETRYYYDDARVLEEQDNLLNTQATYVYGENIDDVVSMDRAGLTLFFHPNALGSVATITDAGANIVEQYAYDAYGMVTITDGANTAVPLNDWGTPHSAIHNPYLFTGRRLDEESGLYYYRARYYDSAKGRFLQRDPLGYVDGMNLYQYVTGRPTFAVDPSGTELKLAGDINDGLNQLQSLCPEAGLIQQGGIVKKTRNPVSKNRPIGCACICWAVTDARKMTVTIVNSSGTKPWSGLDALNTISFPPLEARPYEIYRRFSPAFRDGMNNANKCRAANRMPDFWPITRQETGDSKIRSVATESKNKFGAFLEDGKSSALRAPPIILAHELCGHAWLKAVVRQPKWHRPLEDQVIAMENTIAEEQGDTNKRGRYANLLGIGESFAKLAAKGNGNVYWWPQACLPKGLSY